MLKRLDFRVIPILLFGVLPAFALAAPDFENEVAPVLEQNCLSCHNGDDRKGNLVLSSKAEAFSFESGIVPGNPSSSLLIKLVSGPDPEMPKKTDALSDEQVAVLRDWIAAGAEWPEGRVLTDNPKRDLNWWSLLPIPEANSTGLSVRLNPVDAFIEAELREKGLRPVPEADAETLIRRVTYDLTGLPPSPEEVTRFLDSKDWSATVDRLLGSPAFGEKFAQHWLDVARYAETHGYDKDKPRNQAWPYRDYVIASFNEDKSFSRFVQEQVAGDVLYPGSPNGVRALGFLAAGPWDFIGHWEVGEGKMDGRIAKHLDRDEMVAAVFNAFQSTTVQCAQCHHHKFDPVRMEDYYRLHAVFAAVDRANRVYEGLPPDQQQRKNEVTSRINNLKREQASLTSDINRRVAAKASGIDRRLAELRERYGTGTELKPQYGYHSQISERPDTEKWVQIDIGKARAATEVRLMPAFDNYNNIGAGFGFPVRYRVEASNDANFENGARLLFDGSQEDQINPRKQTVRIGGDGRAFRYLRLTATKLVERKQDYIFAIGEVEILNEGASENYALGAVVDAKDSIESGTRWGRANLVDGIYFREVDNPEAARELADLEEQRRAIEQSFRTPKTKKRLAEISQLLTPLQAEQKKFPTGQLVYAAATHFPRGGRFMATEGKPRPIYLLHRGDVGSNGDRMFPGVPPLWNGVEPAFFEGDDSWDEGQARAELARYLTRQDNPLLWRSIANRIWQWVFGAPLVGTPNDFGRGGMEPSHPELLDFLAATLRDDPNQSIKSLVRLLVSSEAYRRSSKYQEDNAAIDDNNVYLWRANRRRLTAEEVRDSILSSSGALDRRMGGPSFQDFIIEKPQHSPHYQYHLHDPNDPNSHRRSIYRFVVRSQPQPMLTTLDCADPSMSVPQRDESTTALQALTQWNHRFIEAMSLRMGERLQKEMTGSASEKIDGACHLVIGRDPSEKERAILLEHLEEHGEASLSRLLFNMNAFVYVD